MQTRSTRIRLGAVALGSSAFLLALFPLIRPFFALDIFEPEATGRRWRQPDRRQDAAIRPPLDRAVGDAEEFGHLACRELLVEGERQHRLARLSDDALAVFGSLHLPARSYSRRRLARQGEPRLGGARQSSSILGKRSEKKTRCAMPRRIIA